MSVASFIPGVLCIIARLRAILWTTFMIAPLVSTAMIAGTTTANPALTPIYVGLPQVETSAQLVNRLLNLTNYVPDPRVGAEDQRISLLRAIAARGEDGADAMVARLLAMPSSAEDPQGTKNSMRWQLIRDIGGLGDAAIKPAQDALGRARTTDQRREMVQAIGAVSTAASTRALLSLFVAKDEVISNTAISSLTDKLGMTPEAGGSEDVLPALAKVLPDIKDPLYRRLVCSRVRRVLNPVSPAGKADEHQVALAAHMLRERLKDDTSADVRFLAACALTEFGDNSGLGELKRAALAMQSGGGATDETTLDNLVPALERATGQKFGPVPLNPSLSGSLTAVPALRAQRQALLEKIVMWIKANPGR